MTIVPRGKSLGAAWYLPEERQLSSSNQILDEMCAALGGRAAEDLILGQVTTGALSDLEKVTKQARAMVTVYGLNEKLGNITYYDSSDQNEYQFNKPYSEKTAQIIDEEISSIIETQYTRAKDLLAANKDKLTILANELLEKEVIFKESMEDIFGKRPWTSRMDIVEKSNAVAKPARQSKAKKATKSKEQTARKAGDQDQGTDGGN